MSTVTVTRARLARLAALLRLLAVHLADDALASTVVDGAADELEAIMQSGPERNSTG